MELVKAYILTGFKGLSIREESKEVIVQRYLNGDDPEVIAEEEAERIMLESRRKVHEDRIKILESLKEENNPDNRRPLPRDPHVPEGYEYSDSGMIVPERPRLRFSYRYEGQRPDDTPEEHLVRRRMQFWLSMMMLSSISIIVLNVVVAVARIVADFEFGWPIGAIPLPFLIWTMWMRQSKSNKLDKMKLDRIMEESSELIEESREIDRELNRIRGPETETV